MLKESKKVLKANILSKSINFPKIPKRFIDDRIS